MSNNEFTEIMSGLQEAIQHAGGDKKATEHRVEVPVVDVRKVRDSLGLTQEAFAAAFGVSVGTVRNWEQLRRIPRGPARMLLQVIAREPEAVKRVLEDVAA